MACTRREFGFEIINLGESQVVTLACLITLLENALGKKAIRDFQPMPPGDVPVTCADISKAARLLDYHPRVKIEDGLPLFIEWFRRATPVSPK
jgi:UDP-glucuronate 4-epimerase